MNFLKGIGEFLIGTVAVVLMFALNALFVAIPIAIAIYILIWIFF